MNKIITLTAAKALPATASLRIEWQEKGKSEWTHALKSEIPKLLARLHKVKSYTIIHIDA